MVLRLRPEARDDLVAAARWYEAQEIGLGGHFLAEVLLAFFQHLQATALPGPCCVRGKLRPARPSKGSGNSSLLFRTRNSYKGDGAGNSEFAAIHGHATDPTGAGRLELLLPGYR